MERRDCRTLGILFPEAVETRFVFRSRAIEHAFNRDNAALGIVLHVVGENHQLRDVDKAAELFLREALVVHPLAFGHHAAYVIRLLDLDKHERKPIDEQRNVGAKTFIAILATKFRRAMVRVVFRMFEINQAKRRVAGQTLVELLAQIVVIQFLLNVRKHALRRNSRSRIQLLELLRKNIYKDVRLWVVGNRRRCARLRNFSQIRIADASQMLNRSQLNACRFRKKTRHKNLPSKLAFAGDTVTVAVHLDSRAISQKEQRFFITIHLAAMRTSIAMESRSNTTIRILGNSSNR